MMPDTMRIMEEYKGRWEYRFVMKRNCLLHDQTGPPQLAGFLQTPISMVVGK